MTGEGSAGSFTAAGVLAGAEPVGLGAGLEDVGVEGDPVHDRGDQARVGEHGSPLTERQIRGNGDGRFFFAFGDDLEEELGAAGVDFDVAQLVQLCRYPHSWTYADTATMPRGVRCGSRRC